MIKTLLNKPILASLLVLMLAGCGGKSESDALAGATQAMAKRDYPTAMIELKSVLQRSPNQGQARYLLGTALLEQGQASAALLELQKAQDLGFNESLLAPKLARALLATGKAKSVLQTFTDVKVQDPVAQAELTTALAVAHATVGQLKEAGTLVEQALAAQPGYSWALLTKARLATSAGRFDEAIALTERAASSGGPNGEAHMLRGTLLRLVKKDTAGAFKAFELATADPLQEVNARGALIQILLSQEKLPDAKSQLAALQKSNPKSLTTYYLSAVVAYASKEYERADSIVDQLLRAVPDSPGFLVLGGAASLQRGALTSAESKLGKVVQTVERSTVARKLLAETYLRLGQPDKSLAVLKPLLEATAPDASALALAGQAYLQTGQPQQATGMFAAAAKANPSDIQVQTALALTDLAKGNAAPALETLDRLASKDRGETADLALISAYLQRAEHDLALAAIARLERKPASKDTATYLRGLALRGKGDLAAARAAFEEALKAQPAHFASVSALVSMDMYDTKPADARQRLEAFIKANPKSTSGRMALLDLLVREGAKPEVLMAIVDEAIRVNPADPEPYVAKIGLLTRVNDIKGAAAFAQSALAAAPNNPSILDAAGQALSNAGDEQQAISAFNRLSGVLPKSPLPHLRLADLHLKRGDTAAVRSSLNRAFDVAPESSEVHRRMLAFASRSKDFKPVIAAARELQKRFPSASIGFLLEGDAEASKKAWPSALAAYQLGLKKSDPSGRAAKSVYVATRAAGDKAGAERFASEWLKSKADDVTLREYLGSESILRKDYVVAERYFREILTIQPKNVAALNNLAWILTDTGKKGAIDLATQAVALSPSAAPLYDTLAQALSAEGQWDRAIVAAKRALQLEPGRPTYRLSLAKILVKAGRQTEASSEIAILSKLGNSFPRHAEVEALRAAAGK